MAESRLIAIIESSDDAIVSKTLEGIITSWNKGAERIFGWTSDEVVGKPINILIPDERADEEPRILQRLRSGERVDHFETVRRTKDGRLIDVSVTISPIRDSDGRVVGASKVARDVTLQKRHHDELRKAKEDADDARRNAEAGLARWQAVVENMVDGVVIANGQGDLLEWNRAALAMHGFTSLEDARVNIASAASLFEIRTPAGEVIPLEQWPIPRLLRGEALRNFEARVLRTDGSLDATISYSGSAIRDRDGTINLVVLTLHDVTAERRAQAALRDSEARLRAIVEATPECVKIVDPDGTLVYMNHAGIDMIEAPDAATVAHACVYDVIAPEHRARWIEHHQRVCAGQKLDWEFEIVGLRGTRRWMETHAVPLPMADGRIGQLSVTMEITARKRADAEREHLLDSERAARADAEASNRMKDEFLATLSHELRTPLSAILGWSQILRRDPKPATLLQGLDTIERNARAQTQIIEDLLDMSRIVSGKIRLDVQRLDLAGVISTAVETVRHAADAKGVRLVTVLDPLAGVVSGDPNRLQQVFWNLLTNAVKFTSRGGRVQVVLERVNSHLEVSVVDTGEGIKPEFLPYVFDRFRQADASTTRRHGGLGLGLSIVKQLTELHGGEVRVKSAGEGQGSTFIVSLPLTILDPVPDDADRRHPRAPAHRMPTAESCGRLAGLRVLIVDDEPDARALVARLMTDCEAIVSAAGSASEALVRIRGERPDVVISDIGMPDEDGYSLIERIRALGPEAGGNTPAIALTAYARTEDRVRALNAGFQTHITKPVDPAELIAVVASVARRPRTTGGQLSHDIGRN